MADHPLRALLADLRTDMARVAAPGPTTLRRWQETVQRLDDALQMLLGQGQGGYIAINSGVSARTGQGFVHLGWGDQRGQFSPTEARDHARLIAEAAEAAEYDAIFLHWLRDQQIIDRLAQGVPMLVQFRAYRESGGPSAVFQQPIAAEEPDDPAPPPDETP